MRVEDGREIPAGQRTVNLCHGQGAKIHLFHSIRPPLRSHTTLIVANVICFIHRPCVCVCVRIGKKLIRWMKQKKNVLLCYGLCRHLPPLHFLRFHAECSWFFTFSRDFPPPRLHLDSWRNGSLCSLDDVWLNTFLNLSLFYARQDSVRI